MTLSPLSLVNEGSRLFAASFSAKIIFQSRGRRRTLTPAPWLPPVYERCHVDYVDDENRLIFYSLIEDVISAEKDFFVSSAASSSKNSTCKFEEIGPDTRRVGLVARKIGMMPQWTTSGERILCTLLEVCENHVVEVTSPTDWFRKSIIGKRKAFNREGPLWKVTVGAVNGNVNIFTAAYRNFFTKSGVPIKKYLGSFLVSEEALPAVGTRLDIRHFVVGQYVTATGKSIDWGFQGGMHRWGMKGQPALRTTKSHRRIGSIGSVGDARVWPGKRMPGHMGYEWVTVSGLEVVRMNIDKQVIYIKGCVPGDIDNILLLKDCLQPQKKLQIGPMPTWLPSMNIKETDTEYREATANISRANEIISHKLFDFISPTITFSDEDAKKSMGRDRTKAKIAKVKK
ncbi:50S ribosomal protein L3 [Dictyocaulus viviparus]|uniref:Large ribosomal subunit protein uL3m n=1 Tax=Dictyocaulus viviparus TaxID=29172 RepID=A0A0D8XTM2_DICVI|nr:50S ribosomal protein L3 [Dictyocaulus viviparus]